MTADIEALLARLDLEQKVSLLAGQDMWSLPAIPEIGLKSLVMSDGPIGVRGTAWTADDPSVALPSPTALAATWSPELARMAGRLLGQEARRKGVHVLLAPTVNLHRTPRGGRHFECYSEDPLLTAEIGAEYVTGVQEHSVGTTVKHFVANDSETDRFTVDVQVGRRALREMYLAPFETIVERGAWGVMSAYNSVNGLTMTEHDELQNGVLKQEWGFDGAIVSDWTAARSTEGTALGGLDVVMPSLGNPWGEQLVAAVRAGRVSPEIIDDHVSRILRLAARVGALEGIAPAVALEDRPSQVDGSEVARTIAARSFVLARNADDLLPLRADELTRVALIGAAASDARVLGGGSATVFPEHIVSPLDGLRAALGDKVVYAIGADPRTKVPAAKGAQWSGLRAVIRNAEGVVQWQGALVTGLARWIGELPGGVELEQVSTVEITGTLTPEADGAHTLAPSAVGQIALSLDGQEVWSGAIWPEGSDPANAFLNPPEHRHPAQLKAGVPVEVSLVLTVFEGLPFPAVSLQLGHLAPLAEGDVLIAEAVQAAAAADVAVVVVATTEEVESEGFDRDTLSLPGRQDELVAAVFAANPRTVVVVNAGSPVIMPWADDVPAVLLTWFPGQEAGAALADVLLGAVEPGGRMPTTWPRFEHDVPVLAVEPVGGKLAYDEGVFIGYRAWQRQDVAPLLPFGHGLGYTTWSYESLTVDGDQVEVTVRNTGSRPGSEVVQVYVSPADNAGDRPLRWLAGFASAGADPGQAVTVRVPLARRSFQIWADGWQTVHGGYRVEAAHSVNEIRLSELIEV